LSYYTSGHVGKLYSAFGGRESFYNKSASLRLESLNQQQNGTVVKHESDLDMRFSINDTELSLIYAFLDKSVLFLNNLPVGGDFIGNKYLKEFSRIFVGKNELVKIKNTSNGRLQIDASNLEAVLKRILKSEIIQEEFIELCELFIPEFENISIHSDNISGIDTLLIKEKFTDKPFTKNLLSDGTFNILALLTAVYQSDKPQFLCIEEPENGLNPYVIEELVNFFREMCKEKGHIIWLNTHSQTLVRHLEAHEIILIDKKEGITKAKQIRDFNRHGLTMDEAWLSNAIGGGLPW